MSKKTLAGLAAIILATGGGASGVYLRSGDTEAVKLNAVAAQSDIPTLSLPSNEPAAAVTVSADTNIARIPTSASIFPYNDNVDGQADMAASLRGSDRTYLLPAAADQAPVLTSITGSVSL